MHSSGGYVDGGCDPAARLSDMSSLGGMESLPIDVMVIPETANTPTSDGGPAEDIATDR